MDSVDKSKRIFLIGSIVVGVVIIALLIWVIVTPPDQNNNNNNNNQSRVFDDSGNPAIGPDNAKATVRIYSDFQCPACRVAEEPLNEIIKQYKDRVRFIWNDLPLEVLHPFAKKAAIAARCAQEQDYFWDYHDELYAMQDKWAQSLEPTSAFVDFAASLSLDQTAFIACLDQDRPKSKVEHDFQEAINLNLDSTPTFFINQKKLTGAMTKESWIKELNQALGQ